MAISRISAGQLRWRVDPQLWSGSGDVEPERDQPLIDAVSIQALIDILRTGEPGRAHVFIRGQPGSGRRRLFNHALDKARPASGRRRDLAYVHNFDHPDCPKLLRLPPGQGRKLRLELSEITHFIRDKLEQALQSRPIRNRLQALNERSDAEMRRLTNPLDEKLKPHGLVLVREEVGQLVRLTMHVKQTGRIITQDDMANLVAKGQVSRKEYDQIRTVVRDNQAELARITTEINRTWKHSHQLGVRMLRAETRRLLADLMQGALEQLDNPDVEQHFEAITADVLEKRVGRPTAHLADPDLLYGINLLIEAGESDDAPVVFENHPTPRNLVGTIDPSWQSGDRAVASFRGIRSGSIMLADGGLLVLDADVLVDEPECILRLKRVLATGEVSIEAPEGNSPARSLKPDPVPVAPRMILLGSQASWLRLNHEHPAFARAIEQLIDIPESVGRSDANARSLGRMLISECARLELPPLSAEAVAQLVEEAARVDSHGGLSVCPGWLMEIARSAARNTNKAGEKRISASRISETIERIRVRPAPAGPRDGRPTTGYPARHHLPGQVHIVAEWRDGNLSFGRLLRVQCAVAASDRTRVSLPQGIEDPRQVAAAVEALLSQTLGLTKPPGIHAVFECIRPGRGRGGDTFGESFQLGAALTLFSGLSGVPLRQDLAVIGEIDLAGRLLPVPALNERIEDLHRHCLSEDIGIGAGIIIPAVQREALMLSPTVVQATRNDLFQVFAAGNISQVLELLTGGNPGQLQKGSFPAGSLYQRARERLAG